MNLRLILLLLCVGQTFLARAHAADPAPPKPASTVLTAASFAQAAADTDALLAGKSPSSRTLKLFRTYDNLALAYKRNPDCVAAGIDLTCISVANSANADGTGGNRGCVTLITPQHGLTNDHFPQPYETGVFHYFVDRTNVVHARRIIGSQTVAGTDLRVIAFDTPLPASITPAALLPPGATARLPPGTPLLSTNQEKRIVITELAGFTAGEVVVRPATTPGRRGWTTTPPAIIGDSDSPTFVLLDRRPRLLFTYHTNITGPTISESLPAIQAILQGKYPLEVATVR